jgi:hypothetical protein
MKTKQEYIDALGRMKQVYYNINGDELIKDILENCEVIQ